MKPGRWHQPRQERAPEVDALLCSVSRALDASARPVGPLTVQQQRRAGRSTIYVVASANQAANGKRWVIKQPHTEWSQDDVDSPLTAEDEFLALRRLETHFRDLGASFRVPTPVAHLPEHDAFVMEHVSGPTVKQLLNYGSVRRPKRLLDGLSAAGAFLRCVHDLERRPAVDVDLKDEAQQVLALEEELLLPLGLSLPDRVRHTLVEMPSRTVSSPEVWLHGDWGPANVILAEDGSVVGLDPALSTVGHREDDLVRFTVLVAGVIRLAPELVIPPVGRVRRRLEDRLLHSYYQASTRPLLFEVKYLNQLVRRWCRLREMAQKQQGALLSGRLTVVGAQMRMLMSDAERCLVRSLEG